MSSSIWLSHRRTVFWHTRQRRREKHPLDLLVLRRRGLVLCKILYPQPLRKPLSKGVGFSDLRSSKATCDLLSHSKPAQGRMLHSRSVQVMRTVISIVEVQLSLLENARSPDVKIRAKMQIKITRTRKEGRLFRSGKGVLTLPLLQSFQKGHQ